MYGENVRVLVPIESLEFGTVMMVCVGAMMVGSTVITRTAGSKVSRTEELGYFRFGGSTILLFFEPNRMAFDSDLVDNSMSRLETLVKVGMSVGHSIDIEEYGNKLPGVDTSKKVEEMSWDEKAEAARRIEGSLAPKKNDHEKTES